MSILYSDKDGLLWALQKKTVSKNACGEMAEDRFLKPDDIAKDSMLSSDTNFDR
jgi:hypothetical protein